MKSTSSWITPRAMILGGALIVLGLTGLLFHRQIDHRLAVYLFLKADAPAQEVFDELTGQSPDPTELLQRAWATGKVAQRMLVSAFLKSSAADNPPWFAGVEWLAVAGARDADMSVRELALATLEARRDPRLFQLARFQLDDCDPQVRVLGLNYLRRADPSNAVPVVMRLVDDPDLTVVTSAEVALARWSGEDYSVRSLLAIPSQGVGHRGELDPTNVATIKRGIEQRKQWWQSHAKDYPAAPAISPQPDAETPARLPVADFTLKDLEGKPVHLSDYRGKIVLLNFWTTWCTACLAEIPDLIALQKNDGDKVVILGVSLDGIPDEHGHVPGAEDGEDSHASQPSLKETTAKVARTVKSRGMNYPILLDANNTVGSWFNGGELPTTVIIDAEGRVRRRFIGERSLAVFEAMIADAVKPVSLPPQITHQKR